MKIWNHCFIVGILAILMLSCSGGSSLNGTWESKEYGDSTIIFSGKNFTKKIESLGVVFEDVQGTYSISRDNIKFSYNGETEIVPFYRIDNNTIKMHEMQFTRLNSNTGKSSGSASAIPGRWSLEEGPSYGNPEEMDILKGGTGIVDGTGVTWKIENGRFYLINPMFGFSSIYNVSDSTLTLTKDDGTVLKYKKNK